MTATADPESAPHIVYTSVLHADTSPLDVAIDHRATEVDVKNSGVVYTILRNSWYTENCTGSVHQAVEHRPHVSPQAERDPC